MKRKIIALLADMHSGHRLGLCNPEGEIVETSESPPITQKVELIEFQEYLWRVYMDGFEKVLKLAGKDEIIVEHLGDITQGSKYAHQLVAPEPNNQRRIGYWNLYPWLRCKNVKVMRLVTGTPVHDGDELGSPVLVCEYIRDRHPNIDVKVTHHSLQNIDGFLLDVSHHGSHPGIRSWTRGNMLRYELTSKVLDCVEVGETPADLYARAHYHVPADEVITRKINGKSKIFRYILVPCLTGMGHYGRKVTRSGSSITNGITALEIVDGRLVDVHWFTSTRDLRVVEKL